MGTPFLSVVIPAFNEATRIIDTLEQVVSYLGRQSYSWEVVVVDDGSSDGTAALVSQWMPEHKEVRVETIPHAGKGWAVRHGMRATSGEYRFMCDADLAMPIEYLSTFLERMDEGYDIAIGSRQIAGATRVNEPPLRHIMGRIFNWSVRIVAVQDFQDTQCGFKCFRGEVADELFAFQRTRGFGFDVEILYLALKSGLRAIEIPISWYYHRESTVRPRVDSILMLLDIIRVRWNDLRGHYTATSGSSRRTAVPGKSGSETPASAITGTATETWKDSSMAVVVPTYNEASNLPELADRLFQLGIANTRLIVVDDGSPDGTAEVADELAKKFERKVEVVRRQGKQGLGTAYLEGFSQALTADIEYVVQMDADLSHVPEYIPAFLEALSGADVVVGSRYVPGGGFDRDWGATRRSLSYLGNLGIRWAGGLKVRDATSGFKAYRSSALRSLKLGSSGARVSDFSQRSPMPANSKAIASSSIPSYSLPGPEAGPKCLSSSCSKRSGA